MSLQFVGKLVTAKELPGRDSFPASALIGVLDPATGDTLNLVGPVGVLEFLEALPQFSDVALDLRWRRIDLASLGGTGKGKAYRLSVTAVRAVK